MFNIRVIRLIFPASVPNKYFLLIKVSLTLISTSICLIFYTSHCDLNKRKSLPTQNLKKSNFQRNRGYSKDASDRNVHYPDATARDSGFSPQILHSANVWQV